MTFRHLLFLGCFALIGCNGSSTLSTTTLPPPPRKVVAKSAPLPVAKKPVKRVTKRAPNTKGSVLVLEYHKVEATESRWGRSRANFRRDLERLYKNGFRPITLIEYLTGKFKVPPGATPVVFTFDDGHPSQFNMLSDGTIDPNCMVGIWKKFAATRPDFPIKATFFILPPVPFAQKKFADKKLALLKRWGSEVGIHTLSHKRLDRMTDDGVKKEIAGSIEYCRKWGIEPRTMAMPYGVYPQNKSLVKMFKWKGKVYKLDGAVRVGAIPNPYPNSPKIKRWGLPRIQGVDIDYGLTFYLKKIQKGQYSMYVEP